MIRYTEKARGAIFFAHYEARHQSLDVVEPEHLLLGLLRTDPELFRLLSPQEPNLLEDIRTEITPRDAKMRESWTSEEPSTLSSSTESVLDSAAEEASNFNQAYTGTEHLLLSLLKNGTQPMRRVLNGYGLSIERLVDAIKNGSVTSQRRDDGGYHLRIS